MEHLREIVLYGLGGVAFVWIVLSVAGSLPLLDLGKERLEPLGEEEARLYLASVIARGIVDPKWAAAFGFEPAGAYAITNLGAKLVAWTRAQEATYLCVDFIANARIEFEFVSVCDDRILTTGTTKDGQLFPNRPGSWLQTFSAPSASELWNHHEDALAYLAQVADFRPAQRAGTLEDDFASAMRRNANYIRSLRLWPLRTPYWYFVRRNRRHNKSVRDLRAP